MDPTAESISTDNQLLCPIFWNSATANDVDEAIKSGYDVHARLKDDGRTPLHIAAKYSGRKDGIVRLLEEDVNIDARDKDGKVPIHYAAENDEAPEIIQFLLDKGASKIATDKDGKIPFDYAKHNEALKGSKVYWQLNEARFD